MKFYFNIDTDVTELLGITQYIPTQDREPELQGKAKKPRSKLLKFLFRFKIFRMLLMTRKEQRKAFPDFISKTDEVRLQNIPHILVNKDIKYVETEKINGSSITVFLRKLGRKKFDFGVCSRNLRIFDDNEGNYWRAVKKYDIENVLHQLIGDNEFVSIQGEVIAPNIQGNQYRVTEPDLYVFNLIYPDGRVGSIEGAETLKPYGVKWVPIINESFTLLDTVNDMLEYSNGQSVIADTYREGSVFRSIDGKQSFKVVSPVYLLKNDE